MRISDLYARVGNNDLANKFANTADDIDIHKWLTKLAVAGSKDERDALIRRHQTSLREKGYSKADIALPFMSGFSIDYQDGANLVADLVCPVVPGDLKRRFTKFSRRDASRLLDLRMGPKDEPMEASITVGNDTYSEQAYGEMAKVANVDIQDASDIPELFMAHGRAIMGDIKRAREKRVLDLVLTTTGYASGCTGSLTSTNRWDVGPATSTADPVRDIRVTAMSAVGVSRTPNTMVIGKLAFEYLRTHPNVTAAAGARSSDRVLSEQEIAALFGLQNVWVADAKYDSTGASSSATYAYLAPKACALIYVKPGASRNELSFCKTFRQHDYEFIDFQDQKPGVRGVTVLKLTHADAEKIVASDAGFILDTVIS